MFSHLGHFFCLSWRVCYFKGRSLRCSPGRGNAGRCAVTLYVGEGPSGSNGARLTLLRISIFHSDTHNQTGPLWCWFPSKWACAHSRPLWVSPMTSPVRLGVSPAAVPTPTCVFNQRFEDFPALEPWAMWSASLPTVCPGLSVHECGAAGCASGQTACPVHPTFCQSRSHHGNESPLRPGACLRPSYWSGCMFLFYLLGVGLPCHSILCQLWLCKEAQCVYLRRHLGSLS